MFLRYNGMEIDVEIVKNSQTAWGMFQAPTPCEWVVNEAYDTINDRYLTTEELNDLEQDYSLSVMIQEQEMIGDEEC